jgi:hypothetical protein
MALSVRQGYKRRLVSRLRPAVLGMRPHRPVDCESFGPRNGLFRDRVVGLVSHVLKTQDPVDNVAVDVGGSGGEVFLVGWSSGWAGSPGAELPAPGDFQLFRNSRFGFIERPLLG